MKKNNLYTFNVILRILIVIILIFAFNFAEAQIDKKEFYGCKQAHHHHHHKAPGLNVLQKQQLAFSNERSDTIDILHYNINLDLTDFTTQTIVGFCEVSIQSKMNDVNSITLDLLAFNIDSISANGINLNYNYDGDLLTVDFANTLNVEDELTFSVYYNGHPTPAASGFGGLVFQGNIAYNLGIGLGATPYNYGRGWFPCFDTFVERSTYEFNIITSGNKRAYCVGTYMGEDTLVNGNLLRSYEMNQQLPTYLAGVAVGNYQSWKTTHTGAYGDVELEVLALQSNYNTVVSAFTYLDESVDALEYWWGKYPWERVGYVMTGNGAMEHPTNVAYPLFLAEQGSSTPAHNEVMAHELGHHWWGNVTTLNGPQNMWIKEGPAEYSSHLFYEHIWGREEFKRVVIENLELVLEEAHVNDNGYQALSPMPYDQTYGTHTYQKGALVIHNLRGYLGDSLFRVGMQAVLEEYAYNSMSAEQFRDHLTLATGMDMGPFFDAWIFAPGYSCYEVEFMTATAVGTDFEVDLTVQQKLRAAPNFHQQAPVNVTFVGENFETIHDRIIVSGEFTTQTFTLPFEPKTVFLNGEHELNILALGSHKTVTETGSTGLLYGGIGVIVKELTDSALIRIDQYLVAPDPSPSNVYDAKLAKNRYFRVSGIAKDGFLARGQISYKGSNLGDPDFDLVGTTEDSLILLYRPDASSDWYEYHSYDLKILGTTLDGQGLIYIEPLAFGEYTLANAVVPSTASEDVLLTEIDWTIFPNPTADQIVINGEISENGKYQIAIFDVQGKNVLQKNIEINTSEFSVTMDLQTLPNGIYVAKLVGEKGREWGSSTLEVAK